MTHPTPTPPAPHPDHIVLDGTGRARELGQGVQAEAAALTVLGVTPRLAVGRSLVVGKPTAQLLLQRDATVGICHRHTKDLAEHTRTADVLVVAVGRIGLIRAEHVADGAVVIDVGTNTAPDGSLVGDVDAADVARRPGALTPVPGGVGPVTTALLLAHTVRSARAHV